MRVVIAPGPVLTVAVWIQALPAAIYLFGRRRSTAAGYLALGGLLTLLSTSIGTIVARGSNNNLIVGYIFIPMIAAAYMLALAEWQVTYVERVTYRVGFALFAVIYLVLAIFFEDVTHFGQFSHTLYSMALLIASLWTLGRRSFEQSEGLAIETDWFWVAFGFAVYGAATAITATVGNVMLQRERYDLLARVWNVRAIFVILAFLAVSWGVYRSPARSAPTGAAA